MFVTQADRQPVPQIDHADQDRQIDQLLVVELPPKYAGYALTDRLGEVLKTDPAVAALIREFKAAQERVIVLRECIRRVGSAFGIAHERRNWEFERTDYRATDFPEVGVWTAAIESLKTNPDGALPAVEVRRGERVVVDPADAALPQ